MRKPVVFLVCITGLCGVIRLVHHYRTPKEPTWQGRSLSQWLTLAAHGSPRDLPESAQKAIQAMGTNALPHLLRMVARKDSAAKLRLREWAGRGSIVRRWTGTHYLERMRGAAGFAALGKEGAPAVPQLIVLLHDQQLSYPAALSLSAIGSPAVPALVQTLTNENTWVRMGAVQALNFMHGAEEAIPGLLKSLDDPEPDVQCLVALALGDMRRQPQTVVPRLIENLCDTNNSVRAHTAQALGLFGMEAQAAVPELVALQKDTNFEVREAASAALKQIREISTK